MAIFDLQTLIPDAPRPLRSILDGARGPVQKPIRSEIFGSQRFAQHGRSLGETHRAATATLLTATFFPRLKSNIATLREAHQYIGIQAGTGYDISPAAEWLLDNFHLIEAQLKEVHDGLPRSYFRTLPILVDEPLAGLPRVYGVAWAFVAHTDGAFDDDLLIQFLGAYQESRELGLSEMWALPTTLRVVLIENLRRLAERVATNKAAREVANLCFDRIDTFSVQALDQLLSLLTLRGVDRVFLGQMAQRAQDRRATGEDKDQTIFLNWLHNALPDLASVQGQQAADQAADNLSVSNAVTSLRAIGDADWTDIIAQTSSLIRVMLTSPLFDAEDAGTRDQTLHAIERLAKRARQTEVSVARTLLGLSVSADEAGGDRLLTGHWLIGAGRSTLLRSLGLREEWSVSWLTNARRFALPLYLGSLLSALMLVVWVLMRHVNLSPATELPAWVVLLGMALMLFPASEAVVAVVNRLISESAHPQRLPRLALIGGIPPEHRVLVVIPAMLTSEDGISDMVHRLELHYLANAEREAQFALLTDWRDANAMQMSDDESFLTRTREKIRELNIRYPRKVDESCLAPRFIVLHRGRLFSETEQRWIGWERKRGKLELLIATVAQGTNESFFDLGDESRIAAGIKYIVTLDSDTLLPPGRLLELVGVAAHPSNQPKLDASGTRVVSGYGILQPRVATPLPSPTDFTLYHWLFSGQCGIDPYSAASSEVYQDIFSEGTFTGKGLLNVKAMHTVLSGRFPEGAVLSHDLLEGSIARCASVTDISVLEDAPFHADVAASRVHRWTRGDWQLLPFLFNARHYHLRFVNRWKMLDNLRRSLVAPMSLAFLFIALASSFVAPAVALALVIAAFSAGPLMGAVAGFSPSRDDLARLHFYREASIDLARALCGGLWLFLQLLQQSLLSMDAIGRALYRVIVSRRHLLQWTTAAAAQASAKTRLSAVTRQHWSEPVVALALLSALLAGGTSTPLLALILCLLWGGSPVWTWWVSRPCPRREKTILSPQDRAYLEDVARDTWRFFERCVAADDNCLPPDNLQTTPYDMVAHRTSPTNIGLYLLSTACARQFGWIGTQDLLVRLEATLATLVTLQRYRGHFLNWYDTQSRAPLLPMYVSTVDSGNLSGHLLAVAQACLELSLLPFDRTAADRAIQSSQRRLAPLLLLHAELLPSLGENSALVRLLHVGSPLYEYHANPPVFEQLLAAATDEFAAMSLGVAQPLVPARPSPKETLFWCVGDHLTTVRSACLDVRVRTAEAASEVGASHGDVRQRLQAVAKRCENLAWDADYKFLYHPKRNLFHIGFRVTEQELDAGFYDLLASESRLTSLLAVAKGDVPVKHWSSLGRLFFAVGADAGLRSWAGSMFEYLMPSLVLAEPLGSVLGEACEAAIHEQMHYAKGQGVPWGISESAYAASDHTLAYQYAPQGVPRLALRRTPPDELVIAPYATALAAQFAPHLALTNFKRLEKLATRARYGFIEALDYSSARQSGSEAFMPVDTFMAHHQGMSVVALANVLLGAPAQRWGMANAHLEAVVSLLHERVPREISLLYAPNSASTPLARQRRRTPGLLREVRPGGTALGPTHLLSNGRYSVSLRANGAGWSRWGQTGITRWRDDALRDDYGSFFYVRWDRQPQLVSLTQHPAPDAAADYQTVYHADRVCFNADWSELHARTTVWVSPEDDIEFRQVELRNLSEETIEIELISAFEVTLSDSLADETHPAFTNLFVRAEWFENDHALLFERTPRLPTEQGLQAAHFLAEIDPQVVGVRWITDRQSWRGRNRTTSQPLAAFDASLANDQRSTDTPGRLDTGLDPVSVLAVRLRIAPHAKAQLTFATAASINAGTLRSVIDKYRQPSHVQRASLMSATLTGIRLRALRISAENFAAMQTLTTAMVLSLTRSHGSTPSGADSVGVCDRRLLWRFGISGDRPVVLVSAGAMRGLGLLRGLAQTLSLWSWGGVSCDLVVVNAEPMSYLMPLQMEITALRDRHVAECNAQAGLTVTALHVLRADEISTDELSTLHLLARIRLHADGRPLQHHVKDWCDLHEQALEIRHEVSATAVLNAVVTGSDLSAPAGEFSDDSGEFYFDVSPDSRPVRPWINVLANPGFGTHISEAGGGYTWADNSRLNQLTAWSNDPVADLPSEWFLLQDSRTKEIWSVAPNGWGADKVNYQVTHGQGYTTISHRRQDVGVTVTWCVDPQSSVKQVQFRLVNFGHRTLNLRLIGVVEWMMGANRSDRNTTQTSLYRHRLAAQKLTALLCTQREQSAGFGGGTAFFAALGEIGEAEDWTCDRRECFDVRGRLVIPDHLGQRSGAGLDPCAAITLPLSLAPGETVERVFLLGYGQTASNAQQLAATAASVTAEIRLAKTHSAWNLLLGATTVKTPDPLFDAMVNRWLLYQTVSCRLWAKAGFYQAGGATGFRDQLQDSMALAWAAPKMLREQIVLCASRQFAEGDVQHWWHAPLGAGVRTHFSDDLLWLPYATHHYVQATGDKALLDRHVPFIEGANIPEGAEDAYYTPSVSAQSASVYEHGARAIDHSLRVGVNGLPLMGSGDWNDGMNRVGIEGRGESVWLGWFLCRLVEDFAPLARERGEVERALRWEQAAQGWKAALNGPSWDGAWFKRAFFDDGQALGSHANSEARIDLIAQAWAVLSGATSPAFQRMALASVERHLVDPQAGLIKLLAPPLQHAQPSAGYIQAYPAGVRENGGQYSHAGVWALMAHAKFQSGLAPGASRSVTDNDTAYRYFTYLSPAHRASHPVRGRVYGIEPYVMAGDVYSHAPYVGRGGWSWYTGAAAWLHRAAIESIFGLQQRANDLCFLPCLPSHWPQAELTLSRDTQSWRFILMRATPTAALEATAHLEARLLHPGEFLSWRDVGTREKSVCFVVPLMDGP